MNLGNPVHKTASHHITKPRSKALLRYTITTVWRYQLAPFVLHPIRLGWGIFLAGEGKEMERETQKSLMLHAFCALFALCVAAAIMCAPTAHADEALDAEIDQLQAQIESSAQDYDQAMAKAAELNDQIAENQKRIDTINEQLPVQKDRSADSARTLYVLQQEGFGLLEMILSSESLSDFLQTVDYIDLLTQHNTLQITKLSNMHDELQETQEKLEQDVQDAEQAADRASRAMEQAKASRQAAQERALAEAAEQLARQQEVAAQVEAEQRAAAEAAAAEAAKTAEAEQDQQEETESTSEQEAPAEQPIGTDAQNTESTVANAEPEPEAQGTVAAEDVSWDSDRDAFISQWAGRIDAYLGGSPLAGQGTTFAAAAWDYGVDPRWSPAISCVESTKGAYCFLPHNAWGWGSSSWGSWEEAINAHVGGLARGYGSTLTYASAVKYCPPNANHWYNTCLAEMNKI